MLPKEQRPPTQAELEGFNGHPPLGVNATGRFGQTPISELVGFNGHPPLGVNATRAAISTLALSTKVSMGTHPWG